MGCCVSTPERSKQENNHHPLVNSCENSEAPPLLLEEETVKKVVLSETPPLSKLPTSIVLENMVNKNQDSQIQEVKTESTSVIKHNEEILSEISEHSKVSSFDRFSTATAPEKRDDHGKFIQISPTSSPERENGGESALLRMGQQRELIGQRRIKEPENGSRRETAEQSGRQSRSPVKIGDVGLRQNGNCDRLVLRQTGRSPDRKVDNAGDDDDVLHENRETLENPIVSMECFIFL